MPSRQIHELGELLSSKSNLDINPDYLLSLRMQDLNVLSEAGLSSATKLANLTVLNLNLLTSPHIKDLESLHSSLY